MAIVPIGVHTVLLDDIGVPYPASLPREGWPVFPDHVLLLSGLIWLNGRLSRFKRSEVFPRAVFVFLVAGAVNQALLRLPVMRNAVSTRWTIYPFIDNLPAVLWFALATILVIAIGKSTTTPARAIGAAAVLAIILDRVATPISNRAFAGLIALNATREGDQLYDVPYDWHVDLPSYLTYAEPALGAFVTALALRRLGVSPLAIAGAIFALQGGPLFRVALNVWYARSGAPMALLSEGQFTLEALALSVLASVFATLVDRASSSITDNR